MEGIINYNCDQAVSTSSTLRSGAWVDMPGDLLVILLAFVISPRFINPLLQNNH